MLWRNVAAIGIAFFVITSTVIADHHETSTFKQFQEFGELLAGRWVGDIKFIADWPGQDLARGERTVGYANYSWIVDKKAIKGTAVVGNNGDVSMIAWDASSKQIKFFDVNTNGGTIEVVLWKKADRVFGWRITSGGLFDGRAHSGEGEWTFSKDGKTMTIKGQTLLGDEKLDPLKDVYKRLSS